MLMDINEDFIYTIIGKKIKKFRESNGFTQDGLAKDIGVSRTSLANFESGKQAVYISDLYKLAVQFGIQVVELLPTTEEVKSKSSLEFRIQEASADLKEEEKEALEGFIKKLEQKEGP